VLTLFCVPAGQNGSVRVRAVRQRQRGMHVQRACRVGCVGPATALCAWIVACMVKARHQRLHVAAGTSRSACVLCSSSSACRGGRVLTACSSTACSGGLQSSPRGAQCRWCRVVELREGCQQGGRGGAPVLVATRAEQQQRLRCNDAQIVVLAGCEVCRPSKCVHKPCMCLCSGRC
jgi:hypothetical protein